MIAIYKRELKSYFQSMIGYAFVAFLMVFTGVYFAAYNLNSGIPYFSYALASTMFIFLIAIPVLTMRSFAEERKSRTDQLLLTSPVSVAGIVAGKYLAMVSVFVIPVAISCLYPLVIRAQGYSYIKVDYAAILLYFAIGCVYIAIGMFLSSLTESQIIAAVSTFAALLVLYLWKGIVGFIPAGAKYNMVGVAAIIFLVGYLVFAITKNWLISTGLATVGIGVSFVVYITNGKAYESLLKNVLGKLDFASMLTNIIDNRLFDVSNLILCISIAFLFVFLTIQIIQKRRWS